MEIIKKMILLAVLCFLSSKAQSQTADTLSQKQKLQDTTNMRRNALAYASRQFAMVRPFHVEFSQVAPYRYTPQRDGVTLSENKVSTYHQIKANANLYFLAKKKLILGATFSYRYITAENNFTIPSSGLMRTVKDDFTYHSTSLNFTYVSKIFNKPFVLNTSLVVDGSAKHFERLKGLAIGTIVLKADKQTKLMAGILVNVDPSTELPLLPMITYERKLTNGMMIDLMMPKQLLVRKQVLSRGRISLGTELDRNGFYPYNINEQMPSQRYEYRQIELDNGVIYEHLIGDYLILTARTGAKWIAISRLFEKEKTFSKEWLEIAAKPTAYFNLGISFNPFAKKMLAKSYIK
ncbi:hypothetical protein [Sphingobacterium faecium]|uniref:hypothetical protein n=1 Tax=Sphingobacterium faecium TaxID=34087 RepID=UPI00247A6729|nr:hypothetical protein [Sphingobacterium faecium]WGQ13739.1 hypothetical protein QG727_17115 [Sphingobacterium faecium]